jgi:hypothetical protein
MVVAKTEMLIRRPAEEVFDAFVAITIAAAPKMLRIGKTDDREELLAPLVERFVKLSYVRVVLITLACAMALWALVVGSRLGG